MKRLIALMMTFSLCFGLSFSVKASAENTQSEQGSLSITLSKLTLKQKDDLSFKVRFVAEGKPAKGQNLVIQVMDVDQRGIQVFEEETDRSGEVHGTVRLTKKQPQGSYVVVATTQYKGEWIESRAEFTIGMPSQGKELQTDKLSYKKGETVKVKGFARIGEVPLKGVVIPIRILVNERVVFVGEATTKENGEFECSYSLRSSRYGLYTVYANVPGSTTEELSANFKYSK